MTGGQWSGLSRRLLFGLGLGVILTAVFPRHGPLGWDFFDALTVACCVTLLGAAVDAALQALPGIDDGAGPLVRVVGWFAGGLWCAVVARWLWQEYGRDLADLPSIWWGGAVVVAIEAGARFIKRISARE